MRTRFFSAVLLIAAFAGWNQALTAATAAAHKNVNSQLNDSQIEGLIRAKLAKSKMAPEGLSVHVRNKVATWEGKTNVIQHKGAATRMAKTAGAVSVVNNIKISEEARKKAMERLAKYRNGGAPVKHAALVATVQK